MDELDRKRRQRSGASSDGPDSGAENEADTAPATPEDELAERDRQADADDRVAAVRDVDAAAGDQEAGARDRAAEERDAEADSRDRAAQPGEDTMPALFADRRRARSDRADAADDRDHSSTDRDRARGDRAVAQHQRERAGDDRGVAHQAVAQLRQLLFEAEDNEEAMVTIGRAQGMVMVAQGSGPSRRCSS